MKTDLSNTSFIIHYRKDSEDRAFNLKTIYRFLEENVKYKELIIVNDNSKVDDEMTLFKQKRPDLIPLWFENQDHFKKSYAFNVGSVQFSEILDLLEYQHRKSTIHLQLHAHSQH